jgi:hypothetical protein
MDDEMERACSLHGEKMNAYRTLVGNEEGKRPVERPGSRWEDIIKMDLKRDMMGWYGLD